MDFVSVPCSMKLDISGVVCSSDATKPPQSYINVTYVSSLLEDVSFPLTFNIDRFDYNYVKNPLWEQHRDFYDAYDYDGMGLTETNVVYYKNYLSDMVWKWKSSIHSCQNTSVLFQ